MTFNALYDGGDIAGPLRVSLRAVVGEQQVVEQKQKNLVQALLPHVSRLLLPLPQHLQYVQLDLAQLRQILKDLVVRIEAGAVVPYRLVRCGVKREPRLLRAWHR